MHGIWLYSTQTNATELDCNQVHVVQYCNSHQLTFNNCSLWAYMSSQAFLCSVHEYSQNQTVYPLHPVRFTFVRVLIFYTEERLPDAKGTLANHYTGLLALQQMNFSAFPLGKSSPNAHQWNATWSVKEVVNVHTLARSFHHRCANTCQQTLRLASTHKYVCV